MKAIAKHIPIDGKYADRRKGDKWVNKNKTKGRLKGQLYRLFATIRNVKVGDEVVFNDETEHLDNKDIITRIEKGAHDHAPDTFHFKNREPLWADPYKVLGEISRHAIWVKDGDEIEMGYASNKAEWEHNMKGRVLKNYPTDWPKECIICKVKCPYCETYH